LGLDRKRFNPGSAFVLEAYKIIKDGHLDLSALGHGGLLEIALRTNIANDTFTVEAFLKTAKCPFYGFTFF